MRTLLLYANLVTLLLSSATSLGAETPPLLTPTIDGEWWQIAGDPDLGPHTTERQQPVDFAVWQAADGTWQLWSCIRATACGGNTRLFHRWEGRQLTDSDWTPKGIAMEADIVLGETAGGLQAPHVMLVDGLYQMAYGDWNNICFSTSKDGKTFQRDLAPTGLAGRFSEGPHGQARDPMLLFTQNNWHCYYTGHPATDFPNPGDRHGYVFCRVSTDLRAWSDSVIVAYGGRAGNNPYSSECPHIVEPRPGQYYLFRTQRYGQNARTSVHRSDSPLYFGVDDDRGFVCEMSLAAPEILLHDSQYYIATLLPSLKGIHVAKLKWIEPENSQDEALFDFDDPKHRQEWRVIKGHFPSVFTQSKRNDFTPPFRSFIGTAETPEGERNDALTGVIQSPEFTLSSKRYTLFISGGKDIAKTYLAITATDNGEEIVRLAGSDDNRFSKCGFDASQHIGRKVIIVIVDQGAESWGHINFGGIFK